MKAELEELLTMSRNSLLRIRQIVKNFRDVARRAGRDSRGPDLNVAIEPAVEIFRSRAEGRGVRFEVDFAPSLLPVTCAPAEVNQIVFHLLSNAIDACSAGDAVTLRTCSAEGAVEVHVTDTGLRHRPGPPRQGLRAFFHDQAARPRRWDRTEPKPADRRGERWPDPSGVGPRWADPLHVRLPAEPALTQNSPIREPIELSTASISINRTDLRHTYFHVTVRDSTLRSSPCSPESGCRSLGPPLPLRRPAPCGPHCDWPGYRRDFADQSLPPHRQPSGTY